MPVQLGAIDPDIVRPMRDEVLVKRESRRIDQIGSIVVPQNIETTQQKAIVVAVGPGLAVEEGERLKSQLKVGDKVLLAFKWEREMESRGLEDYATIKEQDILCVEREGRWTLLYNQVSVRPDKPEAKSGMLYIPQSIANSKKTGVSVTGTVVDVGPGHRLKDGSIRPLDVKPKDRVVYSPFAGESHKLFGDDSEELQLVPEEHIAMVIK